MRAAVGDIALLILRLAGLTLALAHGWGKLTALASGTSRFVQSVASLGFPAPAVFAWSAALSEVVGGLLVALGLFTRVGAAFAGFTMLVAAFVRHHAHGHVLSWLGVRPVSEETLKAWGDPELAFVYLLCFGAIALLGGGRLSLDRVFGRKP
jgi:putative oxidoreductase